MEQIACELLDHYTKRSEEEAFHALMHDVPQVGARNCLDLAHSARAITFATKAAFESLVDKLWYGGIVGPTKRWLIILLSLLIVPYFVTYHWLQFVDMKEYFKKIVCFRYDFPHIHRNFIEQVFIWKA